MPEYHPGTEIEISDAVPLSGFRNSIPNTKRYMKHNGQSIEHVCDASFQGDYDTLEELLATGDEKNLYNGDINQHNSNVTALMMAAMMGQTECVELLLKAKADPHMKESMAYGKDPEDGKTALDFAKEAGWDDCVEVLESAVKQAKYGWYVPSGTENNAKQYNCWEFGTKPAKGFFSGRPGAAESMGFDPMKYGTGAIVGDDEEDFMEPEPSAITGGALKSSSVPLIKTIPVGLLFPGQGSQYVKMLSSVKDIPAVKNMLSKAKEILGYDLLDLCLKGPESKLEETQYSQPALFVAGLAGVERLRTDREDAVTKLQACAGLSLGEYTALCVAGVFTFEDGLLLVKKRGEAMQKAATSSKQSMVSVAGLQKAKLEALCKEAADKEGRSGVCQIANELFPNGFSCAGTEVAANHLKTLAEQAGALQAKVLKTGGAFHTSLMAPAREELGKVLDEMLPRMSPPKHTVYMNVTAAPVKPGTPPREIIELLKKQLTSTVLWEASMRAMIKAGVSEFYEVGPMKQLKAMMKRIDSKVWGQMANVEV